MTYRIMTVCTGNICRSPMAEVVLRERLAEAGLGQAVRVDSTGISDEEHGRPIDRRAAAALRARGYDVARGHRARRIEAAEALHRDLILPMTHAHARALTRLAPDAADAVRLYRSFDPSAADGAAGRAPDLADPWYGGPEDFAEALDQIEAAADGVVDFVAAALGRSSARS